MSASYTCPKCRRTSYNPPDVVNRYCGACHVYADQLLAFRIFVDDELVSEHWRDAFDEPGPEDILLSTSDAALCKRASAAGLEWRLEIYDPGEDRTVRLGSSSRGMRAPEVVDLDDHDRLMRRIAGLLGYE